MTVSTPALALVVRCLTCGRIECAKVISRDVWPPDMERMAVEAVRQADWCAGHE